MGFVLFLLIRNRHFFLTILEVGKADKIKVPAHSVSGDNPFSSVLTLAIVQLLAPAPVLVNGGIGGFVCFLACFSEDQGSCLELSPLEIPFRNPGTFK